MSVFSFFGEVDKIKGQIGSEYPAWTMPHQLDTLREGIGQKERTLKTGYVGDVEATMRVREDLKKEKARLEEIVKSKPKLTAKQKEDVATEYGKLKNMIAESLFSRSDMKLGLADAHEEADRMTLPFISVDKEIAAACNVPTFGGKVSRDGASKMYKIIGRYLGDRTNVEYLRKNA